MKYNDSSMLSIRVDKKLKSEADALFKDLGINMSSAVNMFLTQCVREEAIPFKVTKKLEPSDNLKEALNELDEVEKGNIKLRGYHDVDKFVDDMLK